MTGSLRVLGAEWYRLRKSRSVLLGLGFLLIVPALRVFAAWAARTAAHARRVQEAALAGRELPAPLEDGNAWAPFVDGWKSGLALGTLLLLLHASRSLAGDRESGVLRLASTRSAPRSSLVVGRMLMAPLLVLGTVVASGLGAWLAARGLFAFGPLIEEGYELVSSEELRAELMLAIAAALPPLIAVYAFGLWISSLGRSATAAVSTSLALFLAFDLFKEVLGDGQYWVFAAFAPSFIDHSALQEMAGFARGYSDAGYPDALLWMNFWLPWPWAALFLAGSLLAMARKAL